MTSADALPQADELAEIEKDIRDFFVSEALATDTGAVDVRPPMEVAVCASTELAQAASLRSSVRFIARFHHQILRSGTPAGYAWTQRRDGKLVIVEMNYSRLRAEAIDRGVIAMAQDPKAGPLVLLEVPDRQLVGVWSKESAAVMVVHAPEHPSVCWRSITEEAFTGVFRETPAPMRLTDHCVRGYSESLRGPREPLPAKPFARQLDRQMELRP